VTNIEHGWRAETAAALFLERKGCAIIDRNWRTRWCEIDIVAQRGDTVYFCEVKYRRTARQGNGLDYVTTAKQRQMRFAAQFWLAAHIWRGASELCAIEVSGPHYRVTAAVHDV
jgi:ribonuclease HII